MSPEVRKFTYGLASYREMNAAQNKNAVFAVNRIY